MSIFGRRRADCALPAATPHGKAEADGFAAPVGLEPAEIPQATLAFCAAHRIHPVPLIYATVYTYLGGANTALNLAFAAELARGTMSAHVVLHLHDEHLHAGKTAQGIGEIGIGLGREVDQMTIAVEAGIEAGSSAKSELARLADSLDRVGGSLQLVDQAREIREIGLRQLSTNVELRETLRVTRIRLDALERDLARHMAEANTDHLTKLPNRRAIDARLVKAFARPANAAAPGCLIMVDVDHFKAINDTHGHDIGDSVIRMVAETLRKGLGAEGYAARWGGEEFAVLLEAADRRAAMRHAETLRRALEAARWTRKRDGVALGEITASLGVAERRRCDSVASLCRRADAALYRAKAEGRNRSVFLEDEA